MRSVLKQPSAAVNPTQELALRGHLSVLNASSVEEPVECAFLEPQPAANVLADGSDCRRQSAWSAFVINHLVRFAEVDDSRSFFEMQLIGFMNCTDAICS